MEVGKISFSVNRNDVRSFVDQVADGLRQAILGGRYKPGDELPSSRELVSLLGVSRIVTKAALTRLVAEGYIIARTGVKPVVRESGAKQWRGHVVLVYENGDNNYLKTMLASAIQDCLSDAGYLFSQASVFTRRDKTLDFSHLEAILSRSVDLVIVMYHRPEIYAYLAKRKVRYAVFGERAKKPSSAVGAIHFDYNIANESFAAACKAQGVKEVVEIYWHKLMCDVSPELKKLGIRVKKIKVPVDESEGRLIGVKRAGRQAFKKMLDEGMFSHNAETQSRKSEKVFFIADDYLTEGALITLSYAGIKSPEDVQLVTLANAGLGPDYVRPLSRMEVDAYKAGETVAKAMLSYFKTGEFPSNITVGPKWIDGETMKVKTNERMQ